MFGNPETTTGGRALKFYSSVRIDIRRIGAIKDGDVVVGGRTRVKVVKNKVAPPFREAEFDVMYGEGISKEGDLLDLAVDRKIVDKSGTWFAFNGDRLGQGRENVKQFLKDNPEICKAIETRGAPRAGADGRGNSGGLASEQDEQFARADQRQALPGRQLRSRPGRSPDAGSARAGSRSRFAPLSGARLLRACQVPGACPRRESPFAKQRVGRHGSVRKIITRCTHGAAVLCLIGTAASRCA